MSSPLPDDEPPIGNEPYLRRLPADSPVRRDLITRGRNWLGWLGLLVPLGVCATVALPDGTLRRYSPGAVAAVHATWNDRCAACHAESAVFMPADDQSCITCHQGPPHSQKQKPAEVPGCTECHREHQGRAASLTRVADSFCIRCHANLTAHTEGGRPRFDNVRAFDRGDKHPPFRFEREKLSDPGRLKFNHKRHLTPGMRLKSDSAPFTLGEVDKAARDRYRLPGQEELNTPVELTCADCHRLDSMDASASPPLLARGAGDYMVPVTYDLHCRACHPLTVERKVAEDPRSGLVNLPHHLQPDKVRGWLEMLYTSRLVEKPDLLLRQPMRLRPGRDLTAEAMAGTARDHILGQISRAQTELYVSNKTCAKCHHLTPAVAGVSPDRFDRLRVEPTAVPQVWLKDARFDHSAHRTLECRACHPRAYAFDAEGKENPEASDRESHVLLPGIKTCAECHAPSSRAGVGGARHDCVECHRYHGGDHPLHGRGAEMRGVPVERRMGTTEFNHGRR